MEKKKFRTSPTHDLQKVSRTQSKITSHTMIYENVTSTEKKRQSIFTVSQMTQILELVKTLKQFL